MSAEQLGVRVSPELRRLIRAAGGRLNPAVRALLILGAAAMGQDVRPLWPLIGTLIERGDLQGEAVAALRRLMEARGISSDTTPDTTRDSSSPAENLLADLLDDPLSGVGIEV